MINPKSLALLTVSSVGVLGFASGAFGTFSSSVLSGYTCSAYGYFVGFGYGYDCTQNPAVTVTGGTLGTVSTISGTTTAAERIEIGTGTNVVFNPTGNVRVTIPSSTVITPVGTGAFDSTAILASATSTVSGLGSNEQSVGSVDFGVGSSVGLNFSIPVRIDIPVPGYTDSTIAIKVKHAGSSVYTTSGLTNNPNTTCTNGTPGVASAVATVSGAVATIYTCQASTFTTYRVISTSSSGGGGIGGGGTYVPPTAFTSAIIPTKVPTVPPVVSPNSNKSKLQALRDRLKLLRAKRATMNHSETEVTPKTEPKVSTPSSTILYVNVARVALRNEPRNNSTFLGYVNRNTRVTALAELDGWVKVRTATTTAWAQKENFRSASENEMTEVKMLTTEGFPYQAKVNVAKLSMWNEASMKNSRFLGYLFRNQKVTVLKVEGEWAQIQTPYYTGWVVLSRITRE